MSERYRYRALIATLIALIVMFVAACVLAYNERSVEAIGISGALTGLIALAGTLAGGRQTFDGDKVEVDHPPDKPVPTTDINPKGDPK